MSKEFMLYGFHAGADLNFRVKAYSSQKDLPETAPENTIAVITNIPISSYTFCSTQPTQAAEGLVWISTGRSSTVAFSATKRNPLNVYPTGCSQYVNGAWVSKIAKTFMGGAWKDWLHYLYDNGNQCQSLSGGWIVGEGTGSAEIGDSGISLATTEASPRIHVETKSAVDLTLYSKLYARVNVTECTPASSSSLTQCRLGYVSNAGTNLANVETKTVLRVTEKGEYTLEMDIGSVTGSHRIVFGLGYASMKAQPEQIWLS